MKSIDETMFGRQLLNTREGKGYSQAEAAELIGISIATLRKWEKGEVIPGHVARETALMVLRHSKCAPNEAKQKALQNSHHLWFEEGRGWVLRFTVEIDKRQIGKRLKVRLRTHDLNEAIQRRELLVCEFGKLGLKIADRRQAKQRAKVTANER